MACSTHRLCRVVVLLSVALASRLGAAPPRIETAVQARYPAVLASWARGDELEALTQLTALEPKLIRPKAHEHDVEELWRAKLAVIRDAMARSSVEILVPIMLLQHDASRRYSEAHDGLLARHAEVMAAELAQYYVANSNAPSAPAVAGDLLASLAGYRQSGLMMHRSAELFREALQVDSSNFAAHMGLGSLFERRGELESALEHYALAASLDPESSQALLRQAVCAARLGDASLATSLFDRVLLLGGPDWVQKLAYQEKARLFEDPSAGAVTAREALNRFPGGSRQAIELAFFLERQGQSQRAHDILGDLPETAEPESERYRYARWPQEALELSRARLRQEAQTQNGLLAVATAAAAGVVPTQ
jgi:tetratricopeptide (TPR) repeat protein